MRIYLFSLHVAGSRFRSCDGQSRSLAKRSKTRFPNTVYFFSKNQSIALFSPVEHEGKNSPYSIADRRVPELIPVLGSQPAGDVSHKPGGRLPLLSARPAVTLATLKRTATNFAAW